MGQIFVIGSLNMDIVNHVRKHPLPGETIRALGIDYSPGGKGGNQAVAASLAGGKVSMIGAVGEDSFGPKLIEALRLKNVDIDHIVIKPGSTGLAFISVAENGENMIILNEGANSQLTKLDLPSLGDASKKPDMVLLQNEIAWETTVSALEEAHAAGIPTLFNPAPAVKIPNELMRLLHTLVVNETEAEGISGLAVRNHMQAEKAARYFISKGVQRVIITLGEKGSLFVNAPSEVIFTPAFPVQAVDTTAAWDTFIGAFAAAALSKLPLHSVLRFASAASALTVTRKGAQDSIPNRTEIEAFLRKHEKANG